MSAFSFPGEAPSSGGVAPAAPAPVSAQAGRNLPAPPGNPRLPKPPSKRGGEVDGGAAPASVSLTSEMAEWGAPNPEEGEWRQVYQDLVALKQQCGENVDGFAYEKFEGTLRKTRDKLMTGPGVKKVKFSVYVKDGKAALKANPLKE